MIKITIWRWSRLLKKRLRQHLKKKSWFRVMFTRASLAWSVALALLKGRDTSVMSVRISISVNFAKSKLSTTPWSMPFSKSGGLKPTQTLSKAWNRIKKWKNFLPMITLCSIMNHLWSWNSKISRNKRRSNLWKKKMLSLIWQRLLSNQLFNHLNKWSKHLCSLQFSSLLSLLK